MYASNADERSGLIVGIYRGPPLDEDYARCIASIVASDANAAERQLTHTCVLVTGEGLAPPPPIWRQRMAEANNLLRAEKYYFAFVTPRLMLRGVFTAITWLTRKRPGHHLAAFSDVAQAALWLEQQHTGHTASSVRWLYEKTLNQLLGKADALRNLEPG